MTILVQNFYFAPRAQAREVLANRCDADKARRALGLPAGRTFALRCGSTGAPRAVWQQEFIDLAAWRADLAVLSNSPRFGNIRARQSEILTSFARGSYELVAD